MPASAPDQGMLGQETVACNLVLKIQAAGREMESKKARVMIVANTFQPGFG
jgi:hypothetical protein